jgi:hypothetical protein
MLLLEPHGHLITAADALVLPVCSQLQPTFGAWYQWRQPVPATHSPVFVHAGTPSWLLPLVVVLLQAPFQEVPP